MAKTKAPAGVTSTDKRGNKPKLSADHFGFIVSILPSGVVARLQRAEGSAGSRKPQRRQDCSVPQLDLLSDTLTLRAVITPAGSPASPYESSGPSRITNGEGKSR
jgi:hypothetical protein